MHVHVLRRRAGMRSIGCIVVSLLSSHAASAATAAPEPTTNYTQAASWACRPGAEDTCTRGLDAVAATVDGAQTPQPFRAATDPAIDCFYVYPTVSREDRPYSDLAADASVMGVIRDQAGRLAARCRLFVPLYRQATLAHLRNRRADRAGSAAEADRDVPFDDVAAAWNAYLLHDNHGRGVVLVGHSQGAILLQRLIAEQIDGKPAEALLVAAFLAGDPSLGVPAGRVTGGTFVHVPACTASVQVGCVRAWGSYRLDDDARPRAFGHAREDGLLSLCSNPAAPDGGNGMAKSYFPPAGPEGVWLAIVGRFAAVCSADAYGAALRVTVESGPDVDALKALLKHAEHTPGWGLHTLDIALYLGNILDLIEIETGAWVAGH